MENIPIRNINQKDFQQIDTFSIRDITERLAEKDMVQELHRHDFLSILAIKKGSGNHEIDFSKYKIQDNSVFVLRPGQVHQLSIEKGTKAYLIQFKNEFLYHHNNASQNHLTKVGQINYYELLPEGFNKIETLIVDSIKEYNAKVKGYQEVLKANLSILLIEMLRQRQSTYSANAKSNLYAQEILEHFLELVEKNIITLKQVSQYTDLLHLSSYQLSTITKNLLNKTPSEILNDYIILEAKRQLLATSNQVSQIAYNLGYDDVSYFIRFFKKHTSFSPEIFRQNSK